MVSFWCSSSLQYFCHKLLTKLMQICQYDCDKNIKMYKYKSKCINVNIFSFFEKKFWLVLFSKFHEENNRITSLIRALATDCCVKQVSVFPFKILEGLFWEGLMTSSNPKVFLGKFGRDIFRKFLGKYPWWSAVFLRVFLSIGFSRKFSEQLFLRISNSGYTVFLALSN